ncbi:hypothetical protein ADK64_37025 [Streptomyces sp. MMG1121]|nr:hypothetical protein ADK64_37025 [Streptomyces sp. MMG1121]
MARQIQGVECSVMSVTHSLSGAVLVKFRSTRSAAVGVSCRSRRRRLPGRPLRPAFCMRSMTVPWLTEMPCPRLSSA